jgi:RimJ/RimL family protein N-acetyltransferase/acyl carrier protein
MGAVDRFGSRPVVRVGTRVTLLEIEPSWYAPLHAGLIHPEVARTWRWRGQSVPVGDFERLLFQGVSRLTVVVDNDDHLVGVTSLGNVEGGDGHAELSVAEMPPFLGSGLILQGAMLFVDECLATMGLRKIYLNLTEDSANRLSSALQHAATIEGVLRDHFLINGRRQDMVVAAVTRSGFVEALERSATVRAMSPTGWRCLDGVASGPGGSLPESDSSTIRELEQRTAAALGLDPDLGELGDPGDELDLRSDLNLDSMAMLELLCLLDEFAGREVPLGVLDAASSVGDLRRLVRQLAGQASGPAAVGRRP